jgi:hypothetical protein
VIVETMTAGSSGPGGRSIMAQRYYPEIAQGDKRVILIDGKAVPHALARIAKPGEVAREPGRPAAAASRSRCRRATARSRRRSGPCLRRAACCWWDWM